MKESLGVLACSLLTKQSTNARSLASTTSTESASRNGLKGANGEESLSSRITKCGENFAGNEGILIIQFAYI